jgi:hypothetical protein
MNKALKYACALSVAGLMAGVAQADTIKVGVIGTMSGPYALFGQNFKAGSRRGSRSMARRSRDTTSNSFIATRNRQIPQSPRRWRRS